MMKNLFRFLPVFLVLFIVSCSSDDDNIDPQSREDAILGQWSYKSIEADEPVDVNGDGIYNTDLLNTQELDHCLIDNLFSFTDINESSNTDKNVFTINENGRACEGNQTYANVENDTYQLTNENSIIDFGERKDWSIIDLTANELIIEDVIEDVKNVDDDIVTVKVTVTFNRD